MHIHFVPIDTHHKLRLVTLGGIDGYNRLIVYLQCCSNDHATTVLDTFHSAVYKHKLPSRVRSDQGKENQKVAQYMLETRDAERRSMITGSSVHVMYPVDNSIALAHVWLIGRRAAPERLLNVPLEWVGITVEPVTKCKNICSSSFGKRLMYCLR